MSNGASRARRSPIVFVMDLAVRSNGIHLVATTTSPFFRPAARSARDSAASERPAPYSSAVSNQLIPAASETATIRFSMSAGSVGQ